MSDDQIVMHCAATLRDRKAGSLFAAEYDDRQSLYKEIAELNARLSCGNIRTMVLGFTKKRALVYLYRPNRLAAALSDATAQKILQKRKQQQEAATATQPGTAPTVPTPPAPSTTPNKKR